MANLENSDSSCNFFKDIFQPALITVITLMLTSRFQNYAKSGYLSFEKRNVVEEDGQWPSPL